MESIKTLADFQSPSIDDVLCEVTFTAKGGGALLVESEPLEIVNSGIKLHFLRYGLFPLNRDYGRDHFIVHAPDQNGYNASDIYYDSESEKYAQRLEEVVVLSPLEAPEGAIKPKNYEYRHATLKSGYIYVFYEKNLEFHKEIFVNEVGQLVNIKWDDPQNKEGDTFKDVRTPTSKDYQRVDDGFLIPELDDDPTPTFRIAFSPVQWSVEYHERLRTDSELRNNRTKEICCTGIKKGEKNKQAMHVDNVYTAFPETDQAEALIFKNKLEHIANDEKQQKDDFYEDMFVVLDDPFTCAYEICEGIDIEVIHLKAIMLSLQTGKSTEELLARLLANEKIDIPTSDENKQHYYLHNLAQLSYDFVYNSYSNEEKYASDLIQSTASNIALDLTLGSFARPFIEQKGVDKKKLEKLLGVEERANQRKVINSFRDDLGNFMASEYYQIVCEDYLNSIADSIEDGKGILADHTIALSQYPNMYDRHLDLNDVYKPKDDFWYKVINDTLYQKKPKVFTKSTQVLDFKIPIQDIVTLDLVKKTVGNMRKLLKAYASHSDFKGGYTTKSIHGKISYFRDKHTKVATFYFKALENFDEHLAENKKQIHLQLENKDISLKRHKNNWHIEFEKMTAQSAQDFIDEGKVKINLKNLPKRFEKEVQSFLQSKAMSGVLLMIESVVWAEAFAKWNKEGGRSNFLALTGASIKLGAAISGLAEETKIYNAIFNDRNIRRARIGTKSLGILSSGISFYSLGKTTLTSYRNRDDDAAVAFGVATGLSGIFLAADISGFIGFLGGATFLTLGFLPAALLGGAIVAIIYLTNKYLRDNELQAYYKNFPLSDYAMHPDNQELPYQYYQRLLANLDKAISGSGRYEGFKDLEVAFVELTDILEPNYARTEVLIDGGQLKRASRRKYHTSLHYVDTAKIFANKFKVYFYSAYAIHDLDDLDIQIWYYPNGIKPNGKREIINNESYKFPTIDSYDQKKEVTPSCVIEFSTPLEFRYEFDISKNGFEYQNAEVLFLIRVIQDKETCQYSPEVLHSNDRYFHIQIPITQVYYPQVFLIRKLTGKFESHYSPTTSSKKIKPQTFSEEQALHKRSIFAIDQINLLESYKPKDE